MADAYFVKGDLATASEVATEALVAAERTGEAFDRLFAHYQVGAPLLAVGTDHRTGLPVDGLVPLPAAHKADANDLRVLIRAAIHEMAGAGQAVIVAHAGSMALGTTEGVLLSPSCGHLS